MFAIAVIGLITVAKAPGYLAVVLFFASVLALIASFILLYAQGIIRVESKGESK
jgi:energy-converting hydrogenase Eha subunit C